MDRDEARRLLSMPGGMFEVVTEDVLGRPTQVFQTRERSMREKVQNASVHGDRDFLVHGDNRITYANFVELVWGSGRALLEQHGLRKGDRIGILAFNRPEWLVALFGATSAGAVGVGLNGWWSSEEIGYGLEDSGCRYLIVDDALYPRVAPILPRLSGLEKIFYVGGRAPSGTTPIGELLVRAADAPEVPIAEDDPFVLLYTSGTTGRAKACITTHRGTIAQVQGILYSFLLNAMMKGEAPPGMSEGSTPATLLTSPLFHVAGLHSTVCTSMTVGARLVFGPAKFDPPEVLSIMARERVSSWMAIPTLLTRLLDYPGLGDHDLSSLQTISTGGAPAPPEVLERAQAMLPARPSAGTTYGLTESHGMATSLSGEELQARRGSVGRPMPTVEVRIVDGDGRVAAAGASGEILLRGPTITPGYWNRPDASAETVRDGWLHTGDIGYLDADGYLYISDRAKDMILRGGENVYCFEIENCISEHPGIEEAAVVGVPDPDLGEAVKAIVRRRGDSDVDELAVQAHVAEHLARFKIPATVEFVAEPLPRNAAGKLMKKLLRGNG